MKTLTQILLENEFRYGLNLKDNINVKKLEPLTDTPEFKFLKDVEPVNIFKFTMTKTPKVQIGGEAMDPGDPVHVVKTFHDTVKNSNMGFNSNSDFLVIHKTTNKRIWYFIEVIKNKKIGKSGQIPMSVILDKLPIGNLILKNYQGNSYYRLSGAQKARQDAIGAKMDQDDDAAAVKENRQEWMGWIPQKDYENGKTDREHINRIRKLVGDKSVNDTFDNTLEKYLKAWQKYHRVTISGEWDNASQEKAIGILQDRPYRNLNTEIETYSALKKPIAKDKPTTDDVDRVALAKNYRQWANSTDDLRKKYGKKSQYKLDATGSANDYFDRSYAVGQADFTDAGGMNKTFTATLSNVEYSETKGKKSAWGKF